MSKCPPEQGTITLKFRWNVCWWHLLSADFLRSICNCFGFKKSVLQTIKVEEPIEDDDEPETKDETEKKDDEADDDDDDDTKVEDDKQEEKPKTKTVEKTVWDWEVLNDSKPIWTRK